MRKTVLTCDRCGKVITESRLSIAIFPYKDLLEFCDDCSTVMERAIRKAMEVEPDESQITP